MFESFEESRFQASEPTPSAIPVLDAMQSTVQDTVSECEEVQGYSIERVMTICSIARRTAFKYAAEILEVWFWVPEYEFRVNGVYSELALAEIKRRKALGNLENYRSVVHGENTEVIALHQQQQPTEQTVTVDPPVSAIARIQQDRYVVPNFGSDRLAKAQERSNNQRSSLTNTRERVRQALLGLATQTAEDTVAGSLDKQSEREAIYEEAYADGLEELQIRHAAKRDAAADWEAFKAQAMGKPPTGNASSVAS